MRERRLSDAMTNWPPTAGAGPPDSHITQPSDVIKRATVVEVRGTPMLSLSLEGKRAASEAIAGGNVDAVRRIAAQLNGQTIEAAGRMPLGDHEMAWEEAARTAISQALKNCEKDEIRGRIYLWTGHDHHYETVQEEFSDYSSLYHRLIQIGETEWVNYVPMERGPVFEPNVEGYVADAIDQIGAEDFFFSSADDDVGVKLFDASEVLSPQGGHCLRVDVEEISQELIRYLARHPDKMNELTPRKFEELVAELFRDMGYEVKLTPASKDGGFDITAVRKTEVGTGLYFIECKRYSAGNKVGVEIVRSLHGVVESEKATGGIVVTTSFFTRGAFEFRDRNQYHLELADRARLQEFLDGYGRG